MLRATLDTFTADEILVMVGRSNASGALMVQGPKSLGAVYCEAGAVTFASTDADDDLLNVLTRAGFIKDARPTDAAGLAEQLMSGGIDMQRLHDFVRHRTEESVFEMALWTSGQLEFERGVDHPYGDAFSYPIAAVIDGVNRRRTQWARFLERLPSADTVVAQVPSLAGDDGDLTISRTQWRVLAAVNGQRTIAQLANVLGTGLFSTVQLLIGLLDAGLIAIVDRPVVEEPLAVAASRMAADGGITYDTPLATRHVAPIGEPVGAAVGAPVAAPVGAPGGVPGGVPGDAAASDPGAALAAGLGVNGIEFINGAERPSRDLILRMLSAVKEI